MQTNSGRPTSCTARRFEVLPTLLRALGIDSAAQRPWLFGHSDGGSIALLHAARFPERVHGVIVLAPHILVEDISVASIEQARSAYTQGDLRQALARHHADPDSVFWGWNGIWLNPAFRSWTIADQIAAIRAPLLAVQGLDDAYGTLAQIRGIAQRVAQTQLLELPACGHAPHRDQPAALIAACAAFIQRARPPQQTTQRRPTMNLFALHPDRGRLPGRHDRPLPRRRRRRQAQSQATGKLKVGLMLPATGTFAALRHRDRERLQALRRRAGRQDRGPRHRVRQGRRRKSDPAKATDNVNKLIKRDNVDVSSWAPCTAAWRWPWPRLPRTAARC